MGARLIAVAGPLKNTEVVLTHDETLIGRDPGASVVLNSPSVSRRHCVIRRQNDKYLLRDLGSHNGTLLNQARISEQLLQHGDRISIADSDLIFSIDEAKTSILGEVTESS